MKGYMVSYPIAKARDKSFRYVEKLARARLKRMYHGTDWKGAEIVADVKGNDLTYTIVC